MLGHGQVDTRSMSGQNRSNFQVGILDKNWYLFDSSFFILSSLVLFLFLWCYLGGLQHPKNAFKKLVYAIIVVFGQCGYQISCDFIKI